MDLSPFKHLIKERTGLSFENHQEANLKKAIQEMTSRKGLPSPVRYFQLLVQSEGEFHRLIDQLTINETYFFREPAQMKVFAERLIPELLAGRTAGAKVRILSAGCSTGEEPYSLVMALMERYGPGLRRLFSVLAADIDGEAIRRAQEGIYGQPSFRSFDPGMRGRYFEPQGTRGYRIKETVKEMVEFHRFNLLCEPYPLLFQQMDLISYRNVSIYFEPDTQRKIFGHLANALSEGGYLITGSTETLTHDLGVLSLIEVDSVFLYRKSEGLPAPPAGGHHSFSGKAVPAPEGHPFPLPPRPAAVGADRRPGPSLPEASSSRETRFSLTPQSQAPAAEKEPKERLWEEALSLVKKRSYPQSLEALERIMALDPGASEAHLLQACILLKVGQLAESAQACRRVQERDPFCLENYILLGLIARENQDEEEAVKKFKEALYLRSSCWLAHYYLAEVYRTRGEAEKAQREYGIVLRLVQKEGLEGAGVDLLLLFQDPGRIVAECRKRLSAVQK